MKTKDAEDRPTSKVFDFNNKNRAQKLPRSEANNIFKNKNQKEPKIQVKQIQVKAKLKVIS